MAPQQPPTTFRIEDLKARLKLEPKSRVFYPLAEELRKLDRFEDAEKVLRNGLGIHVGYTSAWISLGRVLLEQQKYQDAVDVLQKACGLDRDNVVAARLLADAYLALGEKVEAIKKYKLVRALLPADEEIETVIARLEVELHHPEPAPGAPLSAQSAPPLIPEPVAESAGPSERLTDTGPFQAQEPPVPLTPALAGGQTVQAVDVDAAMRGTSFTAAAEPYAEEIVPPRAEVVGEPEVSAEEQREFPQQARAAEAEVSEQMLATETMADLYARQGYHDAARDIYIKLLEKQPENEKVREKLRALPRVAAPQASEPEREKHKEVVSKLETWLSKVTKK